MLKVSQKLEYAMRAMIELAQRRDEEGLVPAREIAERQQIPLRFLEQQLGALSKAGLVESFRGAGGGCRLSRAPEEITMAEIADAIEGQIFPMFCLEPATTRVSRTHSVGCKGSGLMSPARYRTCSRKRRWRTSRPATGVSLGADRDRTRAVVVASELTGRA